MEWTVKEGVLHGIYNTQKDLPKEVLSLATVYEGEIPGRVGWNIPFSFLRCQEDVYSKSLINTYGKIAEYLVVYSKNDIQTKKHELLHAKYAMDQNYRKKIHTLWESLIPDDKTRIRNVLCQLHYPDDPEIQLDEFQAYYYTERSSFFGLRSICKSDQISKEKKGKKK